jgi:hypothetical protein
VPKPLPAEEKVPIIIRIPPRLKAELDQIFFDPLRGRILHGSRTKLITQLLIRYLEERKRKPE